MADKSAERLRAVIKRFCRRRIAVVGDLMLDRFIRGSVTRVSPEAPVPVVEVNQPETLHLGGSGNVAANLSALGARPFVFGVLGRDAGGQMVRRELRRLRIGTAGLLTDATRPTTVKTRIIADHQHVVRADWEDARPLDSRFERQLLARLRRMAGQFDAVVLSDYDKGVLTESLLEGLLASCAQRRVPVFIDLKRPRRLEPGVHLVLVNQRRAEEMAGRTIADKKTLEMVARHLMARFPCATLIVTRGAQGMEVFHEDSGGVGTERFSHAAVRTQPWEVFDVTGAGDTVMATLTLAIVSGAGPEEAARLANHAAGVVVSKLGTAVVTARELQASLRPSRRQE